MTPKKRRERQVGLENFFASSHDSEADKLSPQSISTQSDTPYVKRRRASSDKPSSWASDLEELDDDQPWGVDAFDYIAGLACPESSLTWRTARDLGDHVGKSTKAACGEIILKRFDLDRKFGPCRGISRRARFERAVLLELDPPLVVDRILKELPEAFNKSTFDQRMGTHS